MYVYGTVLQLTIPPEQLEQIGQLFDERLAKALANFAPSIAENSTLPEFLTRQQTADTLQVSLTTLHDWARDTADRSAILVPFKINGRVRYRRNDVLAALKESRRFKSAEQQGGRQS